MVSAPPSPPTICHPLEWESAIEGGVKVSTQQQRKAFDRLDLPYTRSSAAPHDVLHVNFPGPKSLASLLAAKRANTPVVAHAHSIGENIEDTYRFSSVLAPFTRWYFARFYNLADVVVAVSPYMRERLIANGVTSEIRVVSNGVDGAALDGVDDLADPSPKYGVSGPTVVNLAQVYAIKGVDDFVGVARELPETDFVWAGPRHGLLSPSRTKRAVAAAPPNARFPGYVEDKREVFAMGDVFFFPTHRDNQPLAVLEAMYCGMPIVTRDIPAFDGWLEHGVNCLKGDSNEEFVAHIERLRDDPDLRERLGANAKRAVAAHDLTSVGEELRSIYRAVVRRRDGLRHGPADHQRETPAD